MNATQFLATTGNGLARAERQENREWTVDHLLGGQDVRCLAADLLNPGVVYAGLQDSGVLQSIDGGKTWQACGLSGCIVKSLAVSRTEPGVVYAGVKPPHIYRSPDGGETWTELTGFQKARRWYWMSPAEKPFTAYVQALALSPTNPNVFLAGIEAGAVVRSEDGGRTWSDHRPEAVRDCHTLTFHASNGDWVYEGGGTGPAFSRDAGRTWRQPKAGLDRSYGWAAAADPARPEVWYVSTSPGPFKAHSAHDAQAFIFRSVDGAPWQKLNLRETGLEPGQTAETGTPQPLNHMPYALLTDPRAPGHLYAGLSSGEVWHSTDYGDTWMRLPFSLGGIRMTMIMV